MIGALRHAPKSALAERDERIKADAWDEALAACNDYSDPGPNPYRTETKEDS